MTWPNPGAEIDVPVVGLHVADRRVHVQDDASSSSICGVTSSATPEKNGRSVMVGNSGVGAQPVVAVDGRRAAAMLVMKNSSVPTFSTAF